MSGVGKLNESANPMPSRNPRSSRSRPAARPPVTGSLGQPGSVVGTAMEIDGPHTPEQVIAGLPATSEGEDLVQLLTPEGQRVSHPQFDLEISPAELQSLYRDMVLVRRADPREWTGPRLCLRGEWVAPAVALCQRHAAAVYCSCGRTRSLKGSDGARAGGAAEHRGGRVCWGRGHPAGVW
jgi:hypothetical protein